MKNRLSHSSTAMYQTCPQKWKYNYQDKLRSKIQSAALLFGSAVDKAITAKLKGDPSKNPINIFGYNWRFQDINGVNTYLPKSPDIAYANADYDEELLLPEDIKKLQEELNLLDPIKEVDYIYKEKEVVGFAGLTREQKITLNYANWLCLYRKGLLMLEAVDKHIIPNITEVLGTQEYVSLPNAEGDSVIGYVDLVARWKGFDVPIIFDVKTSAREYERDSVLVSPQLTLYMHGLYEKYQTRKCGFLVLNKNVRKNKTKQCSVCGMDGTGQSHRTCNNEIDGKRCKGAWNVTVNPEVYVQIIIDEIPEQTENIVLDNYDHINKSIKNGIFHRNLNSCIQYGSVKCAYYDLCYKGSSDGLVQMESKKKNDQG